MKTLEKYWMAVAFLLFGTAILWSNYGSACAIGVMFLLMGHTHGAAHPEEPVAKSNKPLIPKTTPKPVRNWLGNLNLVIPRSAEPGDIIFVDIDFEPDEEGIVDARLLKQSENNHLIPQDNPVRYTFILDKYGE